MRLALVVALSVVVTFLVACGGEGIEEPAPAPTTSVQQAATTDGGTKASTTTWTYTNGGVTHEDVWNTQR